MHKRLLLCFSFFLAVLGGHANAQWTVINLHPAGAGFSFAIGASGANQVGYAHVGTGSHASLWSVTAASWVDLNPDGSAYSYAYGASGATQVGWAQVGLVDHAGLWSGTAASWVDLHPAVATWSEARGASGANQVGFARVGFRDHASLWSGTAASWVDLNPAGLEWSYALGASGATQVGYYIGVVRGACLWSGTAASWVDLHPAGATESEAYGASGDIQVGYATVGEDWHASLWSGNAASWVDLHPAESAHSMAYGASGVNQVGYALVGVVEHASLWCGSAASWQDLHALLPDEFYRSRARSMTTDGVNDYIAGEGFNSVTGRYEALLWVRPVMFLPSSFSLFRGNLISGGLSELLASDDQWLSAQAGITLFAGESPLQLIVTGTSPTEEPCELRFTLEAHVSTPGLRQTVYLFNYVSGQYEEVGFWPGSASDSIAEVTVTTNPERFVQAGTREMKAKVAYSQVGLVLHWPWYAHFDHTFWTVRD